MICFKSMSEGERALQGPISFQLGVVPLVAPPLYSTPASAAPHPITIPLFPNKKAKGRKKCKNEIGGEDTWEVSVLGASSPWIPPVLRTFLAAREGESPPAEQVPSTPGTPTWDFFFWKVPSATSRKAQNHLHSLSSCLRPAGRRALGTRQALGSVEPCGLLELFFPNTSRPSRLYQHFDFISMWPFWAGQSNDDK